MIKSPVITSVLTSIAVFSVFSFFFLTFSEEKFQRGDDAQHHSRVVKPPVETVNPTNDLQDLRDSVNELLDLHQQAVNENKLLQERVILLESNLLKEKLVKEDIASSSAESEQLTTADQEAQLIATEEDNISRFDHRRDQVSYEEYDDQWAAEMASSFLGIDQRLQEFGMDTVKIVEQYCRSESCYVEFSHEGEIDHMLFTAIVSAPGTREITFKRIRENGIEKTQAIYSR